jgi:hypothetical protein
MLLLLQHNLAQRQQFHCYRVLVTQQRLQHHCPVAAVSRQRHLCKMAQVCLMVLQQQLGQMQR